MPQEASAATSQGRPLRFRRWAYQANVMNTFESTRSSVVWNTTSVIGGILPGSCSAPRRGDLEREHEDGHSQHHAEHHIRRGHAEIAAAQEIRGFEAEGGERREAAQH